MTEDPAASPLGNATALTSKPIIEAFDVIVIVAAAVLAGAYFVRDKLWSNKQPEKNVWGATTNGSVQVKNRDFIQKMKEGNKNCILFFGSQTGTAEDYAGRLAKEAASRFGLRTMIADLEEYDMDKLDQFPKDSLAFFVMATYGEGEPTDNAVEFWDNINSEAPMFSESSDDKPLSSLRYVVFGLGNKTYEHYNEIGRVLDAKLEQLGAKRVASRGEGDDDGSLEEDFLSWKEEMWVKVKDEFGLEEGTGSAEASWIVTELEDTESQEVYLGEHSDHQLRGRNAIHDSRNPYLAPITTIRELYDSTERNCLHIDLDISSSGMDYMTGDHVAIWPINAEEQVDKYLKVLDLEHKRNTIIDIKNVDFTANKKSPFPVPTTYETVFRSYLEINGIASRQFLASLAAHAPSEETKKKLSRLGNDKDAYKSEVADKGLNIAEVLSLIHDKWEIPFAIFIDGLQRLQPRYYSISSSPKYTPHVSVTAVVGNITPPAAPDRQVYGVTTNYLHHVKHIYLDEQYPDKFPHYNTNGPRDTYSITNDGGEEKKLMKIPVHIRRSNFKLPSKPSTPIIMIGPGSGVAPFRGFFQERVKQVERGAQVGETLLFYGCRREKEDFLYRKEWTEYIEIIGKDKAKIFTAFSREVPNHKVYVQHRLIEQQDIIYDLMRRGAYIYVCGDAKNMAKEVQKVLINIIDEKSGHVESAGTQKIKEMRDRNMYQEDVWS